MYQHYFKRLFDIILSIIVLPLLLVILVFLGPLIYMEDKGSVFYKAKRRGRYGEVFEMYKFRTMKMNAPDLRNEDNSTYNSKDDFRLTCIGKKLRSASIDELPQIFNIIKGDMSFVGPRPITIDKPLDQYDEKRIVRLKARPGLTGFTQAYYRNSITQEEKMQYDANYVKSITFLSDFKIILKTVETVLQKKYIYK
ncbi:MULTISPECIES: sugar transferase [Eubacterium]|uniref:Sugar transferase involved in LPS biosynthesis (Colanic, teichoic acid) n=1 Tax=Eubacterium barkeri TaxID=1528 RepID=A0A1H3GE82_EUBBA|nr:sugar transferase [Eubacterium barkeri]SDY01586.1 Sugar transferase involved in LPS biosynthesis (colanic, teichoic acid) [Eubacterium barkeri]